jgi:hypothetical protein
MNKHISKFARNQLKAYETSIQLQNRIKMIAYMSQYVLDHTGMLPISYDYDNVINAHKSMKKVGSAISNIAYVIPFLRTGIDNAQSERTHMLTQYRAYYTMICKNNQWPINSLKFTMIHSARKYYYHIKKIWIDLHNGTISSPMCARNDKIWMKDNGLKYVLTDEGIVIRGIGALRDSSPNPRSSNEHQRMQLNVVYLHE